MLASPAGIASVDTLDQLYTALAPLSMDAGWRRQPGARAAGSFAPGRWRYRDGHAALEAAGRLVSPELTERRNVILMNPGGGSGSVTTLVAAYQLVLPGEHARSHRHTAAALRLVLDGAPGMYTIVDGVRLDMRPGDVVLTPSWCWHGHRNESEQAAYFVDYLDSPLCRLLDQYRFEPHPDGIEAVTETALDSPYVYPWERTKAELARTAADPSGRYGRCIALDRHPMRTVGLAMHRFDAGRPSRELVLPMNSVYSVVEGRGRSVIGDQTFDWERGDVFVAPGGCPHAHEPQTDAYLLRVHDGPALAALDLLQTETIP